MTETPTIEITALANGGDGIGRIDGQVCFVPGGVPGDELRIEITRRTRQALWGRIEAVLQASPDRRKPICPYFGVCGGCNWLHIQEATQDEWKRRIVQDLLQRMGGVETGVEWGGEPEPRLGYRTRATFQGDGDRVGFHERASHDVVPIDRCPLCHDQLNEALNRLREVGIKGTVTVTVNPEGGEPLVWSKFTNRKLKQYFPLAQSPKDEGGRASFLFDEVPIVNGTFSQSSLLLNRQLRGVVCALVGEPVSLLDLYCGNGNLSLPFEDTPDVLGLDHNKASVKAAYRRRKGSYQSGGEDKMIAQLRRGTWDTVLLDPPRSGAKILAPALAACSARAIVYVSCDPATLARDVRVLAQGGWRPVRTVALDLFPATAHVETVCRLERPA